MIAKAYQACPKTLKKPTLREFITAVRPGYIWYPHCQKLTETLEKVARGDIKRLMVFLPPRHSKSETVSRLFAAYFLVCHPDRWVGLNSYSAELAFVLSRAAREFYQRFGKTVKSDASAVKHWETERGGGMWAAGVGGPITGKGFHLGIIDDPLKNAEEAASEVIREKQKEWYSSTFYTREEPDGAIIVIQTRWNEDDLSGWLLAQENDELPEKWHVVNLPAIAESDDHQWPESVTVGQDWRQAGQALCPERYDADRLAKIRARIGSYYWHALYQQRPSPREGSFFQRAWFSIQDAVPVGCTFVRYWDNAATEGDGDYTAGVLVAKTPEGRYLVVDVVRGQWSPYQREQIKQQTAQLDKTMYGRVTVWQEQEPGGSGKESAQSSVRGLAGHDAHFESVSGDKQHRAEPFAAQCEAKNVSLVRGEWNAAYLNELCSFPHGRHDDQVDGSSGAFNKLCEKRLIRAA